MLLQYVTKRYPISKPQLRWSTVTAHTVSVGYFYGVVPAQAWWPSNSSKNLQYYKLCIDPSLLRDAAHACCESIQPAVADFPHALAAHARDAATGAAGRHGHR